MTDEAMAQAAQTGDRAAAEKLLEKYKNAVRGIARGYFLEGGDAEDLVQEGMIGLYSAVTGYRDGGMSFKNFAYLCIHRRILSAVKSAARKKHSALNTYVPLFDADGQCMELITQENPETMLIGGEERGEFLALLQKNLTQVEYSALTDYMEGLSIGEIARKENRSEKSAENAVQRAKKKVLQLLKDRKN